jgi:hypothetical protein
MTEPAPQIWGGDIMQPSDSADANDKFRLVPQRV